MAGNRSLAARAPESIHQRVQAAANRAGVDKSTFILCAVETMLEQVEQPDKPTPRVIADAMPRRVNGRMVLPEGRVFERF
jgi:hypothetical protein